MIMEATYMKKGKWELRKWHRDQDGVVYHGFNLYRDGVNVLTMGNDRDSAIKTFCFYAGIE